MLKKRLFAALFLMGTSIDISLAATVNFILSAPQIQASGYPILSSETFDGRTTGNMSLSGSFGLGNYTVNRFTGLYFPEIREANRWGGASGTGKYLFTGSSEITINLTNPAPYIGFWWTGAGDDDTVKVYGFENGSEILFGTYSYSNLVNTIGSKTSPNTVITDNGLSVNGSQFYGNPNDSALTGEYIYAYLNIKLADPSLTFSKISFSGQNFELDSVVTSSVPEPSALSLLAVGLGVLFRRSRKRD